MNWVIMNITNNFLKICLWKENLQQMQLTLDNILQPKKFYLYLRTVIKSAKNTFRYTLFWADGWDPI